MTRQSFVKGAAILTAAGLSARLVGAFFRIILAAFIGDEGVGLYQMAYPVYSTLLAISTAGIPVAVSKLVAENLARDDYQGAYRVFRTALVLLATSGLVISAVMFLGAELFAVHVARDPRAYWPLVAISPAIFIVTIMAAFRGFFQGQQQMTPTAVSQFLEQVFRVVAALLLVVLLLPYGLEQAAAGAAFGAAAGAAAGLGILLVIWRKQRRAFFEQVRKGKSRDNSSFLSICYRILALSIPITVGSLVMPLLTFVDLLIVPMRLQAAGIDTERATALYGQLSGMAGPVVHIPTIMTVALAVSLVPAISEAVALNRIKLVQQRAYLAYRLTMLLALPSAAGLYLLAEPITTLLFQNPEAGGVLAAMSFSVVFLTLYQTTSAVLQGIGKPAEPVKALFYGAMLKVLLTVLLTAWSGLPILKGAALATVIGFGLAALFNMYQVSKLTGMSFRFTETLFKPLLASAVMGAVVTWAYRAVLGAAVAWGQNRGNAVATLAAIAAGAAMYGLVLSLVGGITEEDLKTVPRVGEAMARIAKKLHLIR